MRLKQLFLLLAGLMLISLPSYAYDYKIYPGALCQPIDGAQVGDLFKNLGFVLNRNGQQPRGVSCPIIRDRVPHAGQPGERTPLDIGVWINTTGIAVQCSLVITNEGGGVILYNTQYTDPVGGLQGLFWLVAPEQTAIEGTYSIDCLLPPNTLLLRYIAGEDQVTDDGF
jgi:hypothetical protein